MSGTALLPTLMILGMVAGVVVLFFSLSTIHSRTASNQVASNDLTSLQDIAVNMAIGQLRQGTTESNALWISQPGAVRTFTANSGLPSKIYKLYSARDMVVSATGMTGGSLLNLESDVPTDWNDMPGVYGDLNEPSVDSANGKLSFPVVDPRLFQTDSTVTPEGFFYSNKLASSDIPVNGIQLPTSSPSNQRLPMPVRWIYLLQDGSMGVLEGNASNSGFIPFQGQNNASENNPIVGRIAFWTDDETSKININTASESIHWDTPRTATQQDVHFAQFPPVRNEVQRFGGHPATTCLSTVFFPGERLSPAASNDQLRSIYDVTPRVNYTEGSNASAAGIMGNNVNPVEFDNDRLYASVDEFLLAAPSLGSTTGRTSQPLFGGDVDRLKRARFLLTAESRAPETTAAGTPRVSIWPVSYRPEPAQNKRTSFDNLAAFASTLGNRPYHFRRSGAASNMDDFSNYYNGPANDPHGFGMIHNNYLAQYLIESAKLTKTGYSRSLVEKYDSVFGSPDSNPFNMGTGMVAILEYIRQTNINDTTHSTKPSSPRVPVAPYAQASKNWIGTDTLGQVAAVDMNYYGAPLNTSNRILKNDKVSGNKVWTSGVGREYTVSEVGLVFSLAAAHAVDGNKVNPPLAEHLQLPRGWAAIQVGVVFEGFCPSQGYSMIAPSSSVRAEYMYELKIAGSLLPIARYPGGKVIDPAVSPPQQESKPSPDLSNINNDWLPTPERTLDRWRKWGRIAHNVSHLQYLSRENPPGPHDSGRVTTGDWWVGWGGSGGYWMYADSNYNDHSQVNSVGKDWDLDATGSAGSPSVQNRDYSPLFSRGYFLVPSLRNVAQHTRSSPSTETMIISSARTGTRVDRCIEIRVGNQRDGDFGPRRLYLEIPQQMVVPVPTAPRGNMAFTFGKRYENARGTGGNRFTKPELIADGDVVRTWVVRHGDYRLPYLRLREGGGETGIAPEKRLFVPHPAWDPRPDNLNASDAQSIEQIHAFTKAGGTPHSIGKAPTVFTKDKLWPPTFGNGLREGLLVENATYANDQRPDFVVPADSKTFRENVPSNYPYTVKPWETRDWDNGTGITPDGAYWNKPDDVATISDQNGNPPYFTNTVWDGINLNVTAENQTTSPNQLMPSAVMFGSLPSAISTGLQWTTYLFRPDITPGGHLGAKDHSTQGNMPGAPPDHTLLDLFWMPVVQPYAISEPFSTAGKINMNYRIAPFTYINRATGLHAVMKSEQMLAIPTSAGQVYKDYTKYSNPSNGVNITDGRNGWRHYIDAEKTLIQWEDKFDAGQFFMNASEICEQFLVPKGEALSAETGSGIASAMTTFWDSHRLTGDNSLERPYANLYPRLTTRSNTFRVHYLVQTITKARSSSPTTFDPENDSITGELQGDAVVERSIDPADPQLSTPGYDYISKATSGSFNTIQSLDQLYTWRIRQMRRFMR